MILLSDRTRAGKAIFLDARAIVADCGTRGMRVVAWHAGDKAFMARLHAELTEAFIGSRAAILDERVEAAPYMTAAMVPGKV